MLESRQKTKLIDTVIQKLLVSGKYPTAKGILEQVSKRMRGRVWGKPLAIFRPAMLGTKIGGADGRDIERTYSELREDLELYFTSLIETADRLVGDSVTFQARKDSLKRRILRLVQSADGAISSYAAGHEHIVQDTFNTADMVDLARTTAGLNLDGGYATLPVSTSELVPVDYAGIRVDREQYPTNSPHGSILDTMSDGSNTGWFASLDGKTYSVTFTLVDSSGNPVTRELNGLYINPLSPIEITVSYSTDGYNFYQLPVGGRVLQEATYSFDAVSLSAIRLEITGRTVGLRRFQLLNIGFAPQAVLYSHPARIYDVFGAAISVESVAVELDADTPQGTRITPYVAPVYPDGSVGDYIPIGSDAFRLAKLQDEEIAITSLTIAAEGGSTTRQFFQGSVSPTKRPVFSSGQLLRGVRQFFVDYVSHNWKDEEGDVDHTPTPADWKTFVNPVSGYFSPVTVADALGDPDNDYFAGNGIGIGVPTMLAHQDANFYADGISIPDEWLVIGVRKTTGSGSRAVLKQYGNYRFTTYVYMPSETILTERACFVLNTGDYAVSGTVIAPFTVYLNGEMVAQESGSVADASSQDLLDYPWNFSFKRGWNKLEILVYVQADVTTAPGENNPVGDDVGIIISPNIYGLAQSNPAIRLQAHPGDLPRVSEFALRHIVKPWDRNSWAWIDRYSGSSKTGILFNHNPASSLTPAGFDGINDPYPPAMRLRFKSDLASAPNGVAFMAELSRDPKTGRIPKLMSYKVYIN